ncbi:MAG TPA: mandelate racemase/muconate lactonizing enzyme family protein [Gaiellaceae bacterium]|jgi:L-alanine-DL-glutamate epimerase-like enolase superfamily enzyme
MRVVSCTAGHYRVPREVWWPVGPIGASRYEISDIELVTLDVETDEGANGFGFTYTVGHGGSAIHALLEDAIVPDLLGRDPRDVDAVWHELHAKLHFVGAGGVTAVAIAAADIALWDAVAIAAELPLHRFLGVHRTSIPAYASAVNLALSTAELVEQMAGYRAEGFGAVKMKVGRSLREDAARVSAVREAIGDDCELMVDANMAWDVAEAGRRLRALEPFAPAWLEEPLPPHDVAGFAALQRSTSIPLAAGETLFTPDEFGPYFRRGAIRIPQPDVIRLGVTGWRRVAAAALDAGLPVAPHFIPEIHVHLACAIPNALNLEYLPIFERLLEDPLRIHDGEATPPDAPGHGMRFCEDVLSPYRSRTKEVQLR